MHWQLIAIKPEPVPEIVEQVGQHQVEVVQRVFADALDQVDVPTWVARVKTAERMSVIGISTKSARDALINGAKHLGYEPAEQQR